MSHLYVAALAFFLLSAHPARAVPPPDFIFNVTSQIVQFFSIAVIALSAAGSVTHRFIRTKLAGTRRVVFWILVGIAAIALSGGGAWLYGRYIQQRELSQWLAESKRMATETSAGTTTGQPDIDREPKTMPIATKTDSLDQLTIGNAPAPMPPPEQPQDAVSAFIRRYYANIAAHQFSEAYAMSKKSVPFETFKGWYANTTAISIDRLQRIDEKRSSLELTLTEKGETTRYGVLMDVQLDGNGQPVGVERSMVRVLSESNAPVAEAPARPETSSDYFTAHAELPTAISNAKFQAALDERASFLVLDARENLEFENGHFPDATHIRFADLKAGRWIELPTDRPIYVFCWSGIRGKEVADFLRTKKILARYLEKGANAWVADGGTWIGKIAFLKVYTDDRYKRVFTVDEFKASVAKGTFVVDSRPPASYAAWHIPGSVNIPLMYTPTIATDEAFAQVPPHSTVITVCDGYVNCFDAKMTAVELERRSHVFLGRFAEPWRLKP